MPKKKKLKVLQTMTWLAPGGGADIHVYLSLLGLKEKNKYDLHFTVGEEIYHNPFEEIEGLKIHYCKDMVRPVSFKHDFRALWYYYKLIKREKFDIVHTHETKASVITRVAAWLAGCPIIIYGLHGVVFNDPLSWLRRNFYIWLERSTIWMSDFILSVSQSSIDEYHKAGIAREMPYQITYSGIDTDHFIQNSTLSPETRRQRRAELGISPEDTVLINVGRFSYSKAQRYTIEAFAQLKKRFDNLKLVFVGQGELEEACKAQAKELGIQEDVIFYGFTNDVPGVLSLADINVLTSLREGLPRVVVEASLCGLPTVSFQVEGIQEILMRGHAGKIVPQYDVPALVEALSELIADPELQQTYAERARAHARKNWDYRKMVADIDELYDRLANEKLREDELWEATYRADIAPQGSRA